MLRAFASDARWRVREAVAMALQRLGDADMDRPGPGDAQLGARQPPRAEGCCRSAVRAAAPRRKSRHAKSALRVLDGITASIAKAGDRKSDAFQALRKGLGYCWSVAVVRPCPARGSRSWRSGSSRRTRTYGGSCARI